MLKKSNLNDQILIIPSSPYEAIVPFFSSINPKIFPKLVNLPLYKLFASGINSPDTI